MAAALTAGAMSTVWLNATETEVYAASLLLAMVTLAAAARACREPGVRWLVLTAYLVVLAVPLHLSALVATPAAIVLVAQRDDGVDFARAVVLAGVWAVAIGAGLVRAPVVVAGVILLAAAGRATGPARRSPPRRGGDRRGGGGLRGGAVGRGVHARARAA